MKKGFLENYFKEHNVLADSILLKRKISMRLLGFIICAIIYPLLTLGENYNKIYGEEISTTSTINIIKVVYFISLSVAILGIIWFLLKLIIPSKINNFADRLSYNVKNKIFNILDWGLILPVCACIAVFIYSYIFIITPISGTSMYPTINDGESVFVSYLDKVDQFDVVVLKVTAEDNFEVSGDDYYIKRVIGMPGQQLSWVDKVLYITENGVTKKVDESFLPDDFYDNMTHYTSFFGEFRYKLDGKEIITLQIPDDYYFVMGDNRGMKKVGSVYFDCSKDSRVIGLIPKKNIIGVAKYHMNGIIPGGKIV